MVRLLPALLTVLYKQTLIMQLLVYNMTVIKIFTCWSSHRPGSTSPPLQTLYCCFCVLRAGTKYILCPFTASWTVGAPLPLLPACLPPFLKLQLSPFLYRCCSNSRRKRATACRYTRPEYGKTIFWCLHCPSWRWLRIWLAPWARNYVFLFWRSISPWSWFWSLPQHYWCNKWRNQA